MVGYLTALATWLWESPGTVKEFLSEGSNLQVVSRSYSFSQYSDILYPDTRSPTAHSTYYASLGSRLASARSVYIRTWNLLRV